MFLLCSFSTEIVILCDALSKFITLCLSNTVHMRQHISAMFFHSREAHRNVVCYQMLAEKVNSFFCRFFFSNMKAFLAKKIYD